MRILLAEEMGMCFGVRDALKIMDRIAQPDLVTIHGELVHNTIVLQQLSQRGFGMVSEADRHEIPTSPTVLITAHGISEKERARLASAGKSLIDTTCPLVERVHREAIQLRDAGYFIVLIGKRGHVEVQGIIEDLERFVVVQSTEEVIDYREARIAIICQTTIASPHARAIWSAVVAHNPQSECRFIDTTCQPTRARQKALDQLLPIVDGMIVIGGRGSNNTRELVHKCRAFGLPTQHVQDASELDFQFLEGLETIGITAGTSTLPETIEGVRKRLENWSTNALRESVNQSEMLSIQ